MLPVDRTLCIFFHPFSQAAFVEAMSARRYPDLVGGRTRVVREMLLKALELLVFAVEQGSMDLVVGDVKHVKADRAAELIQ